MSGATALVAVAEAIRQGLLGVSTSICLKHGEPQPLGLFYDLKVFEDGLKDVQQAFGPGTKLVLGRPQFSWRKLAA